MRKNTLDGFISRPGD
jgi:hypothetical protein